MPSPGMRVREGGKGRGGQGGEELVLGVQKLAEGREKAVGWCWQKAARKSRKTIPAHPCTVYKGTWGCMAVGSGGRTDDH